MLMALTSGVDYRIVGVAIVVVRCHPHPAKHVLKEIKVKIFTEMQKKNLPLYSFFSSRLEAKVGNHLSPLDAEVSS